METPPTARPSTALVLGGGGSSGNAWLIGVIAGLHDAGLDVTGSDLVVGTSSGATTAVQITASPVGDLYAATVAAPQAPRRRASPGQLDRRLALIEASSDADDLRRRTCADALAREVDPGSTAPSTTAPSTTAWRDLVAARLPSTEWPEQRVLLTAVDATTTEPVVFDRASGVPLVDAVAASCAGGAPHRIDGRPFVDGAHRRGAENADLATGHDRVLVLSPLGGRTLVPLEWRMHLAAQVEELEASGSAVEVLVPDQAARHAMGAGGEMTDLARRAPSATAGHDHGVAAAGRLRSWWTAP